MTRIKVTLEFYGSWQATAQDDIGVITIMRKGSRQEAVSAMKRRLGELVDEPHTIEWLDITESLKGD